MEEERQMGAPRDRLTACMCALNPATLLQSFAVDRLAGSLVTSYTGWAEPAANETARQQVQHE